MPIIKANSSVALGGERLKIDALIGQGAFAKIYCCRADEGDLWVIKVSVCLFRIYICSLFDAKTCMSMGILHLRRIASSTSIRDDCWCYEHS